jgi:hypothetical protein
MKKIILLVITAYTCINSIVAQSSISIDTNFKTFANAENHYCKGDTLKTIKILETYTKTFPKNFATLLVNKRLGGFYIQYGDTAKAVSILTNSLANSFDNGLCYNEKLGTLFKELEYETSKGDICIDLSNIYLLNGLSDSALYYLQLAETKYIPYKCGNGQINYKTKLSFYFADIYLKNKDTISAINKMFDTYLKVESKKAILLGAKLYSILLNKYSQAQIKNEFKNSIKNIKGMYTKDGSKYFKCKIYDHQIYFTDFLLKKDLQNYLSKKMRRYF